MRLQLPAAVNMIIDVLQAHGYEGFAVGGCVRDSVLNRTPDDWDITTSATPYQVKELFSKTVDTGLQHGTVTVMVHGVGYEVTTYRIDGEYEDGRHPKEVQFTSNLTEDLKRRDFTINAMAYSKDRGLIDEFGGMQDLQRKIIRCVGDPWQRFGEDALRILRAVRFAAQLGFEIEENTKKAIVELTPTLSKISAERIQTETVKLLMSDRPQMWRSVYDLGITRIIMPEFDAIMETPQNTPHHMYNVGEHTLKALSLTEKDRILRLTMLLHDIGKEAVSGDLDDMDAPLIVEEIHYVRLHAQASYEILKKEGYKETILLAVRHHHENYDGSGYPDNLSGEAIPLGARIIRVCDVYAALTSDRPYRQAFESQSAVQLMIEEIKDFDVKVFLAFQRMIHKNKEKEITLWH